MYVPKAFALTDPKAVAALLADHAFALLVTCADGVATASHLPVIHRPGSESGAGRSLSNGRSSSNSRRPQSTPTCGPKNL